MLSSVLNSPEAIRVNVQIMRAFVRMRRALASHGDLARRLEERASRVDQHDEQLAAVIEWIREQIAEVDAVSWRRVGYRKSAQE